MIQPAPRLRCFRFINWLGFWTLYVREVRRFFKVPMQTVAAPEAPARAHLWQD